MKTIKTKLDLVEVGPPTEGKWAKIELQGIGADAGIVVSICGDIMPDADVWNYDYEVTIKPIARP